jgi:hypothetical protein
MTFADAYAVCGASGLVGSHGTVSTCCARAEALKATATTASRAINLPHDLSAKRRRIRHARINKPDNIRSHVLGSGVAPVGICCSSALRL